jgi:hypothetical protein
LKRTDERQHFVLIRRKPIHINIHKVSVTHGLRTFQTRRKDETRRCFSGSESPGGETGGKERGTEESD